MDNHREKIRQAALQAAIEAASRSGAESATATGSAALELDEDLRWQKAVCRFCGTGCGVMVGVKDNRILATRSDPLSPVNKGLACVKGFYLARILYGPNRLTSPLIRKGGELVPASWDEAMELVTTKFQESIERHGPRSAAMFGSGQWTIWESYAASKLWKAGLRSNNIDANARFCMASAVAGFMTTFGADAPMGSFDDIEHADSFFIWGANMAEMHPVLFSRISQRKVDSPDVKVVDFGTQKTRTSGLADTFVLFKPQSDLAILNAMANVIVSEGLYDEDFISRHTVFRKGLTDIGYGLEDNFDFEDVPEEISFEDYRRFLADYTPAAAEKTSGVPAATLIELARLFADPGRRTMSFWTMGSNQHTRGTWVNNLIYNLHLLTGKIASPGNSPFSLTGQPSACGSARETGVFSHRLPADMLISEPAHRARAEELWGVPAGSIDPKPGYHAVEMFRAFERGDIKCMWVMCNNVFQAHPNLNRYRDTATRDDRFLVVSDAYPTRTTELADVVLPAAMWVEKEGAYGNSERRTQFWQKIVEPPDGCRSDLEQIVDFAGRMGHGELFEYDEPHLEKAIWEEYRAFREGTGQDLAPFESYHEARGIRWPVIEGREGSWRYNEEYDPGVKKGSGIEFYGNRELDGRAVIWARPYEPAAEAPDDEYPFWLCTGRVLEHWHSGTMTGRVVDGERDGSGKKPAAPLREAVVNIHPEDAAAYGIEEGDYVKVASRRGETTFRAAINGRSVPQKGMVFIAWFDRERLVNLLTLDAYCPISKQPDFKKCAVRIERVTAPS